MKKDKLTEKKRNYTRNNPFRRFLIGITAFATAYHLINPAVALAADDPEEVGIVPEETTEVTEAVPVEEPAPVYEEPAPVEVPQEVYVEPEPEPVYEEPAPEPEEVYVEPVPEETYEEPVPEEVPAVTEEPAAETPATTEAPETTEAPPVTEEAPAPEIKDAEEETPPAPSRTEYVYEEPGVLKATAVFSDPALMDDKAELSVVRVTEYGTGYNYSAYMKALNDRADTAKEYTDDNTLLYDVSFMLDGKEIRLSSAVSITFEFYAGQLGFMNTDTFAIWHLPLNDAARSLYPLTRDAVNISENDILVSGIPVSAASGTYVSFTANDSSVYAFTAAEDKTEEPAEEPVKEENTEEATEETASEEPPVEETVQEPLEFHESAGGLNVDVTADYDAFEEEVTMKVVPVSETEIEPAVSEAVDGKVRKVQAVDITFVNAEGKELQPIKPIQVVITPAQAARQAEDVSVVHIDNSGNAETVEVIETPDETVAFEAESFSTYAVVYTVDFEYTVDGKVFTYSMQGGSVMSLKQLIIALGIETPEDAELFINEVADVSFSNPALVSITRNNRYLFWGENDWVIESLQPFSTEESMIITMKDGQVFSIVVTDDQESSDLSNFLTNVVVTGAQQNADGAYEVEQGKEYTLIATFAESSAYQFDNDATLTYQIPTGVAVLSRQTGPLKINIVYKGKTYEVDATYDLGTDGQLKINFDQNDPDYPKLESSTNVSFRFTYHAQFDGSATHIQFSDTVERDIVFAEPEPAQAYASKSATFDENTGKFNYTITVNATGEVTNVNVKDVISGDALIFNNDVRVSGNSSSYTDNGASNGFDYTFASMREGEVITITYSANVDFSKDTDKDGKITVDQTKNTVTVEPDGGDPHNAEYSREINFKSTTKSNGTDVGVTEEGDKILEWTIDYNPLSLASAAGDTITDIIGASSRDYMKYYGDKITVEVRDHSGNLVDTRNINYSELTSYSDSSWTYTIPDSDTTPYSYHIVYQTVVDMEKVDSIGKTVHVDNTGNGSGGGADVTPENLIGVIKDVESYTTEEVNWISTLSIPENGLAQAVVTDTLPTIYLNGASHYDAYQEGSLDITGLLPGESYDVSVHADKVVITFYKDAAKTQTGLQGTAGGHTIFVKLTTNVDQEWLQKGYETGGWEQNHENKIDLNGVNDTAEVIYGKPGIQKKGPADNSTENLMYTVVLSGVSSLPVSVEDSFDTSILEVDASKASKWDHMQIWGGNQYSQDDGPMPISYSESENGIVLTANSVPMQADGSYYPYYKIVYYLKVKDGVDLEALAIANGGEYEVGNTAVWNGHESDFSFKTVYDYLDKQLLNAGELGETNRTAKYQITFNRAKATLNNGEPMTMTDTLSSNLSVDYGSIVITTDPAGAEVPYSLSGGKDGTTVATYTIPDSTAVTITYEADVRGNGPQTIVNKASINGKEDTVTNTKSYGSASEGEGAVASFKIVKVDGYDANKKLSGVQFKLFAENPDIYFDEERTMKEIVLTTDENGEAIIDGGGIRIYFNERYHLQEIQEPEDYGKISFDYLVTMTNDMSLVDYGHYIYYYDDSMQIKNWPLEGLVVEKQVESDVAADKDQYYKFRISILNEDGSVNTDFNEKSGDDQFENGVVEFELKDKEQKMFWGFEKGTRYKVEEIDNKGLATSVTYTVFDEEGTPTDTVTEARTEHTGELTQEDEVIVFTNSREESGDLEVSKTVVSSTDADKNIDFNFTVTLDDTTISGTYGDMTFTDGVASFTLKTGEVKEATGLPARTGYTVTEESVEGFVTAKYNDVGTIVAGAAERVHFVNSRSGEYDIRVNYGVSKTWNPTDPSENPTELKVTLYRDGKIDTSVTPNPAILNAANEWKHDFEDLPVFAPDGHMYVYTAEEETLEGYKSTKTEKEFDYELVTGDVQIGDFKEQTSESTLDFTLSSNLDLAFVVVKQTAGEGYVIWTERPATDDEINQIKNLVRQYAAFNDIDSHPITNASDLPYTHHNKQGYFTVSLLQDSQSMKVRLYFNNTRNWSQFAYGYLRSSNGEIEDIGTDFTNTKIVTDIEVDKKWINYDGTDTWPENVTVQIQLTADGTEVSGKTATLSAAQPSYKFENLPRYKEDGETEIVYSVKEIEVAGYESEIGELKDGKITITNSQGKTNIEVDKKWVNADGTDTWPNGVEVTVQLTADGEDVSGKTVILGANKPSYIFENLPKYKADGTTPIAYSVKEVEVAGYESEVGELTDGKITVTNTQETTELEVDKKWVNADSTETWPTDVTVQIQLTADGTAVEGKTATLSAQNPSYKFEKLPKYQSDGTTEIKYSVEEVEVPGYSSETGELTDGKITVTNTQETTEIEVDKQWVNADETDTWPTDVTVQIQLTADGEDVSGKTATLSADQPSYKFESLPKYQSDGTTEIAYSVKEVEVAGYESEVGELTEDGKITITNTQETTEITVDKKWVNADASTTWPDGVTVQIQLTADGTAVEGKTATLSAQNPSYKFEKLPKYKADGTTEIAYSVEEVEVLGYTTVIGELTDGKITVTNTQKKTELEVEKTWANADGSTTWPDGVEVTFQLTADGTDVSGKTITLNANKTSDKFTGLPKYKVAEGKEAEIVYGVKEISVAGYTSVVGALTAGKITVTNTQKTTELEVEKTWANADGSNTWPAGVTVEIQLTADNDPVAGKTLTLSADKTSDKFTNLPKYKVADGKETEIVYGVSEVSVAGYMSVVGALTDGKITVTNTQKTTEIEVNKVWVNADGTDTWPEGVTVDIQLTADGTDVSGKTAVLSKDNPSYKFENLPKYKVVEGKETEIAYSVKEVAVTGYTSTVGALADGKITVTNKQYNGKGEVLVAKTLSGRDWTTDDRFTFTITPIGDAPAFATDKVTITNATEGHTASFGEVTFTKAGTYQWEVTEEHAGETIDGVTYAADPQTVEIKVVVNDEGEIVADEGSALVQTAAFTNTYSASGEGEAKVKKTLEGREWTTSDSFEFTITPVGDAPVFETDTVTITSATEDYMESFGKVTFTKAGTYQYTVSETHKGETIDGVKYDSEDKTITFTVKDDGKGHFVAEAGSDLVQTAEFTNTYSRSGEGEVKVKKTLEGRSWTANDSFEFTITPVGTAPAFTPDTVTVTHSSDAYTESFGKVTFTEPGKYEWTVTETHKGETVDGITYDSEDRTVTIEVVDDGKGNLVAKEGSALLQTAAFTNTYNTKGEITFSGTKTLVNRELKEGEFTFELYDSEGELLESVTNKADGSYSFKLIKYTGEDLDKDETTGNYKETTKKYKVVEKAGEDPLIIYDETEYEITVTLKDDGKGNIEVTANPEENTYDFENTYIVKGDILVQKVLDGRAWTDNDTFTFTITADEGTPMPKETTLEITKDTRDHLKSFGAIEFIEEGTYSYIVTEKKGDAKGMTYDEKEHPVTIKVELDEKGNLVAASDSALVQAVTITNTYVEVTVEKVDDQKKAVIGAELAVKDSTGKIVDQWTTDGSVHEVKGLEPDATYTLTEIKAPEGYEKAADITFSTGKDGRVQALKMVDKKKVIPYTGDTDNKPIWTAGLFGSLFIALAAFLMRRRYRTE